MQNLIEKAQLERSLWDDFFNGVYKPTDTLIDQITEFDNLNLTGKPAYDFLMTALLQFYQSQNQYHDFLYDNGAWAEDIAGGDNLACNIVGWLEKTFETEAISWWFWDVPQMGAVHSAVTWGNNSILVRDMDDLWLTL